MMTALLSRPAFKFACASALALIVDLCLVLILRSTTPMSLTLASAIAFICVGITFYFVHEFWTFSDASSRFSSHRLLKNLSALGVGFCGRVGVIYILERFLPAHALLDVIYFCCGVATSFSLNFLLNKYWVFVPTHKAPR